MGKDQAEVSLDADSPGLIHAARQPEADASHRSDEARSCLLLLKQFNNQLETIMADNKTKTGGQDRERINVNQEYEEQDWRSH
jgi:hypothetical protein